MESKSEEKKVLSYQLELEKRGYVFNKKSLAEIPAREGDMGYRAAGLFKRVFSAEDVKKMEGMSEDEADKYKHELMLKRKYAIIKVQDFSSERISVLEPNEIFVFGSNLAGEHSGGAARLAYDRFGAVWGQGVGLQGQSYAIPTMQGKVKSIRPYVDEFIRFAKQHPEKKFLVTKIGCGIAGFTVDEIAPLFEDAFGVKNIALPKAFCDSIRRRR